MKECELIKGGHTFGLLAVILFCPDLVYIYTFFKIIFRLFLIHSLLILNKKPTLNMQHSLLKTTLFH